MTNPDRPDPAAVRAAALRPLWLATVPAALGLAGLGGWGVAATGGDLRAAVLPGVPAAVLLGLFVMGRRAERRRVAMVLATAVCGVLGIGTASSLGALGGGEWRTAGFQVGCFVIAGVFLGVSVMPWRRVEQDGREADRVLRMFEEL